MLNYQLKTLILYFCLLIGASSLLAQFEQNENYKIYAINLPKKINFANENVPLDQFGIRERLDQELLINTYWQSKTILLIKRANKYFPIIEEILKENNIPDDFKYLAVAESGLENVTSPSGAKGVWQFLEKTGLEYGLEINSEIDERYHLEKSTEAACQYIQDAFIKFGNWTLAAASYNMGKHGLKKAIELQQVHNYYDLMLNTETYRYIFRILAIKEIIENHDKYGFIINQNDYYQLTKTKQIKMDTTIKDLASFALDLDLNYKIIKNLNPWILRNKISNVNNKTYLLSIPIEQAIYLNKQDTIIHICKSKESVFEIARQYNVKIENILSWNNLLPSNKVKKNQQIIILK